MVTVQLGNGGCIISEALMQQILLSLGKLSLNTLIEFARFCNDERNSVSLGAKAELEALALWKQGQSRPNVGVIETVKTCVVITDGSFRLSTSRVRGNPQ